MSSHAVFICLCGVHVPFKYWDKHVKGGKHNTRMARIRDKKDSLPMRAKRKRKKAKKRFSG